MNCIKKLPWSAGKYIDTRKYYPQDRVYCDGSVYASLAEQVGNKPYFKQDSDGTYTVAPGWALLAAGLLEDNGLGYDYEVLENLPSVNGVVLKGDKTPEELGLMPEGGAYTKEESDGKFEAKSHAAETFQTKESAADADKRVQGMLDSKVDKEPGKGLSANDLTDERAGKVDKLKMDGRANEYLNGAGTYSRPVRQGYGVSVEDDNTVSVDPQVIARQSDVANVAADLAAQKAKEQGDIDRANAAMAKEEADRKAAVAALQSLLDILNSDSNVDGSVKKTVADAIARVVAGAPEDLDTLKEIADYIASDKTGAAEVAAAISALNALTEGHSKSIEDLGKAKADKAEVEPYDCTWAWLLGQGDEAPEDKVDELIAAIEGKRQIFTKTFDKNGKDEYVGLSGQLWDKDDTMISLVRIGRSTLSWLTIDDNSSDDYAFSLSSRGSMSLQERLVSGRSIKTVNGESVLGAGDIKTPAPTKVSELENDKGYLTEHQSLEAYYQKAAAQLDNRVVAEAMASLAARLDALEGSRGLLGDATAGTVDVRGLTRCRYPLVMLGHGVPAEANVPDNLPDGLPWDGVPTFVGQLYVNLDAASGGLYYAVGNENVSNWKQA